MGVAVKACNVLLPCSPRQRVKGGHRCCNCQHPLARELGVCYSSSSSSTACDELVCIVSYCIVLCSTQYDSIAVLLIAQAATQQCIAPQVHTGSVQVSLSTPREWRLRCLPHSSVHVMVGFSVLVLLPDCVLHTSATAGQAPSHCVIACNCSCIVSVTLGSETQ